MSQVETIDSTMDIILFIIMILYVFVVSRYWILYVVKLQKTMKIEAKDLMTEIEKVINQKNRVLVLTLFGVIISILLMCFYLYLFIITTICLLIVLIGTTIDSFKLSNVRWRLKE